MAEVSDEEAASVEDQTEPRQQVLRRAIPALEKLAEQYAGRRVLVVSHGATMRIVRDALAEQALARGVENGEVIPVDLARLGELAQLLSLDSVH